MVAYFLERRKPKESSASWDFGDSPFRQRLIYFYQSSRLPARQELLTWTDGRGAHETQGKNVEAHISRVKPCDRLVSKLHSSDQHAAFLASHACHQTICLLKHPLFLPSSHLYLLCTRGAAQVPIMHFSTTLLSTALMLFIAIPTIAQPLFRHKGLHLTHHHHHGHPHRHVKSGLDMTGLDDQKTIQPILGAEQASGSTSMADEKLELSVAAMPDAHDPK